MYPLNNGVLSNTKGLFSDKFSEKDDIESMPYIIEGKPIKNLCAAPFENSQSHGLNSLNSLVNIIYSTFSNLQNVKTDNHGAVYIYVAKEMDTKDEPIRIYNSDFTFCRAKNGCAVYIESYQETFKYEIHDCYFGEYFYLELSSVDINDLKGGDVYIAATFSSFEFARCSFDRNHAGDGGALCYISDTSNEEEVSNNDFGLFFIDCRFYFNMGFLNGGSLFIKGFEHSKPNQIENCIFYYSFILIMHLT